RRCGIRSQLRQQRIQKLDVDRQVSETTTKGERAHAIRTPASARRLIPRTLEYFHTKPEVVLPEVEGLAQDVGVRLRKDDQAKSEVVDALPLGFPQRRSEPLVE